MNDPFEYDVFISFSSADEEIVKPIWQELCSNGLRVFWSDSTLKKEVGNSWFEVIEKSLERSRHMLLVCSNNSIGSKWVQREYRAFFDYCYSPNSRRLIPLLTREFSPKSLPLFLRELQVGKVSDSNFIQEIIPILGGVNIEKLQQELQALQEQVNSLSIENKILGKNAKIEANKVNTLVEEKKSLKEQLIQLKEENSLLNETAKEQEKLLSLGGVNIEELQQERNSLQEHVNFLLIENKTLIENKKIETDKVNELIEENKLSKEKLVKLENQNSSLNEIIAEMEEQEKTRVNENVSLKEQLIKLSNEIKLLNQKNCDNLFNSEIKTEKQVEIPKATTAISQDTAVISLTMGALPQFAEKANQEILDEPEDKEINTLIERLQHPMAYIRESTLNDINHTNKSDPRIIEVIEKIVTSDRVDTIRNLAKKTLITLKNQKG